MSDIKRRSGERGIALVIALLLTAVIGLMAAALSYTISSYLKNLATARQKNQGYYLAYAGSEEMRDYLWNNHCAPPSWCGNLLAANPADSSYQNHTQLMVVNPTLNAALSANWGASSWNFYLKDNDDGDGDYRNDNDGIILASVMAKDPNNNTTTTIEAMFIFKANNNIYSQVGGAPDKSGNTPQTGSGQNSGNVRQSF
ncbi:MAG TPA: hypothetical protein VEI57_17210 [Nitrospirota bacterium]|nr:hypothetical protein [Nitrospirota bacterium]